LRPGSLARLLAPRSVAVVGATERPDAYGSEALLNLGRFGFPGTVYAVNPGRDSVHRVPCHASLSALPEAPDAVIVAIPAEDAAAVVEEAGALGCGGAVVFAAGFAEARDGAGRQAALAAAAARHDLPVCGPNGNGIVSLAARAPLWGDMVAPVEAGAVALVSQSGNLAVNALGSRRGLRLHTVVSCGNQAVLGAADYVTALAGDDGVRSIALYLEDDGDGASWCDAFERCARAGVGVTVLKAGSSAAGAAAAQAHTGAVAGDQRLFRAFVEECGAVWATDPDELLETAKALAAGRRARRPGVAVMTCSGGDASVTADLAAGLGLALPPLAEATAAALAETLPAAATPQNPLDYTSLLWGDPEPIAALVRGLAGDPQVGQVLVLYDYPTTLEGAAADSWTAVLDGVRAGAAQTKTPVSVASTLPELCDDATAAGLQRDGIPASAGLRAGLLAAAALAAPGGDAERIREIAGALTPRRTGNGGRWLSEAATKALCAGAGMLVPAGRVAASPDDAVAAWRELAGPVAIKLSGTEVRHKSDAGGVALAIDDEDAVRASATDMGGDVLVERMAPAGAELLVAARADGIVPVLVVGLGGMWTEVLDDVAVIPLPADAERVERALLALKAAPLLTGARGGPRLDIGAAARTAAVAGRLLIEQRLDLIELNPVIVHEREATVVDALAYAAQGGSTG
jgi:acyl-CoA synthetase (NDP forming)